MADFDAGAKLQRGVFVVEGFGNGVAVFFPADLPALADAPSFVGNPSFASVFVEVWAGPAGFLMEL